MTWKSAGWIGRAAARRTLNLILTIFLAAFFSAALVRVARLGTVAVEGGFLGNGGDLATRVDRLLQPRLPGPPNKRRPTVIATAALAGSFLVLTAQAGTLEVAHRLLEHLAH